MSENSANLSWKGIDVIPASATTDTYRYCMFTDDSTFGRTVGSLHFDGSNWLYADGHVKWMLLSQTRQNNDYLWKKVKP